MDWLKDGSVPVNKPEINLKSSVNLQDLFLLCISVSKLHRDCYGNLTYHRHWNSNRLMFAVFFLLTWQHFGLFSLQLSSCCGQEPPSYWNSQGAQLSTQHLFLVLSFISGQHKWLAKCCFAPTLQIVTSPIVTCPPSCFWVLYQS